QTLNYGDDAILVAFEVDNAVMLLMTTALVTDSDATGVIPACLAIFLFQQRLVRGAFMQFLVNYLDQVAASWRRRVCLNYCHDQCPPTLLDVQQIDVTACGEANIGFARITTLAETANRALALSLHVQNLNRFNLHIEELLDSLFDLRLGRIGCHLEHNLAMLLGKHRGLFGDMRPLQDLKDTLLVHPSISSIFFSAGTVTTTFS